MEALICSITAAGPAANRPPHMRLAARSSIGAVAARRGLDVFSGTLEELHTGPRVGGPRPELLGTEDPRRPRGPEQGIADVAQSSDPGRFPRPLVGPLSRLVVGVSGPAELLDKAVAGLPEGAARAEAIAVRLRRLGAQLEWGEPEVVRGLGALLRLCHERGRSSLDMLRADPSLATELQIGSWFQASWRERLARRLTYRWRPAAEAAGRLRLRIAADAAFWAGARSAASSEEWRRLARSSYAALVYHRLAGEGKPGQERIDLSPERFAAQLRFLRRLDFHPLRPDELLAFHADPGRALPRRSFAVTVDDGLLDCAAPLAHHVMDAPQLFVPTRELGGSAHWLQGEPLMGWSDIERLAAAGVAVGSHARAHRPLTALRDGELEEELSGSLADLRERVRQPLPVLAYPNGRYDGSVRRAASAAGFEAAYTTEKGRNGAGTDRYCLRRVTVHAADGRLAALWKAVTGEAVPAPFRWWRRIVGRSS